MSMSSSPIADAIYKKIAATMPDNPILCGRKIYSQYDEDGIIEKILKNIKEHSALTRSFIEFGSADGLENNTHALLLNNYSGCWIEGALQNTAYIEQELGAHSLPRLLVLNDQITLENIVDSIGRCIEFLGTENIDFLSMDLDGNDYHFMSPLMEMLNPKVVCVEYNAKFPPPICMVMEYRAEHCWKGDDYYGASLQAWVDFFTDHTLVCCNVTGVNAFFVRNDLRSAFTPYSVAELYQPARYSLADTPSGHVPSLSWLRQNQKASAYSAPGLTHAKLPQTREFPFYIHTKLDQYISPMLSQDHIWEEFETTILLLMAQRDDIFLDIGANLGWYAAVMALKIENIGRIHAFEPDPDNFAILEKNIHAMQDFTGHAITAHNCAIGNKSAKGKLFLAESNMGDHRLFSDSDDRKSLDITITTLDDLFHSRPDWPTLVKLDTQGCEAFAFEGASRLFNDGWRPVLFFELWPFGLRNAGSNAFGLWKFFDDLRYMQFELRLDTHQLRRLTETYIQQRLDAPEMKIGEHFMDILAIPPDSKRIDAIIHLIES